ncbi:MAG: hypothetical protein K2W95_02820 [Candidatus Obscuribacterales bacterium]|nr:hypothetical protein [Candidatus Obscuribacterales bacterium]
MKLKRGRKGGTLGFVVASAITLILLAICFFFVTQLLGGGREHVNALDAACLNVAKFAVSQPVTQLSGPIELSNFATLGDDANGRPGGSNINLRNYNRLVGQAALVAFNAEADPGPGNRALTNANNLINALQTGDGSIGDRLTKVLQRTSGNILFRHTDIAKDNSVRMLGKDSSVIHIESEYKTSFLEQDPRDPQATNLALPPAAPGGEPANSVRKLFENHNLIVNFNGRDYLRGYEPLTAGSAVKLVGVPVPPGQQPHLVSRVDFNRQDTRFPDISHSKAPPNGVKTASKANAAVASTDNLAFSWAVVGTVNNQIPPNPDARIFFPSIPRGYIEIVNGPETPTVGPIRGETWLENEGNPAVGTRVVTIPAGQIFGDTDVVGAWEAHNAKVARGEASSPPGVGRLFMRMGNSSRPATVAEASQIRSLGTRCTDGNVGSSPCSDLWNNNNGAFDHAFWGGATNSIPGAGTGLTAVECADCQLEKMFNTVSSLTIDNSKCPESGLRIFKTACSASMPTFPKGSCKSTEAGTIRQLGNYASRPTGRYNPGSVGTYGDDTIAFIVGRMRQMKPSADQAEIDNFVNNVLDTRKINPGTTHYIYVAETTTPSGQLVQGAFTLSTTRPPGFSGDGPDGSVIPFSGGGNSISYSIQKDGDCGIINANRDWDIHAVMYHNQTDANFTGVDTARTIRSSGFNNVLGRVEFANAASGSASRFSEPD